MKSVTLLFASSFFLLLFTNSYCQVTTPAQWTEIRAARERNEARQRQEQKVQTNIQNTTNYSSGNSSASGKYSATDKRVENKFTYEDVVKEEITLIRTFSVSDKYCPYVEIDKKYKQYGIYSGGKKFVHVYQTYGSNKGNFEVNHSMYFGQGSFEVFNALSKNGIYEGNWDGNKMVGTYKNKGGQIYTGKFENLEINGEGTLTDKGISYTGTFTKGILENITSINYGGGIVYEGPTVDKLRQGYGYITYSNGKIQYVGEWAGDKKNGDGAVILENGNHLVGVWIDDKEEGDFTLYDPTYVPIKTIVYKAGVVIKQTPAKKTVAKATAPAAKKTTPPEKIQNSVATATEPKKELNVKPAAVPEQPVFTSFDKKEEYYEERAVVKKNNKYGYVDKGGKLVVPLIYDDAIEFREGLAGVMLGNKYGFIDRSGNVIIPIVYDKAGLWFDEGFVGMQQNGKWGFVDKENKTIAPFIYDDSQAFKSGLAAVLLNGKWGFIGKKGQVVVQLKYDEVYPFDEDITTVSIGKKWGYINLTGQEIIPVIYDALYPISNGKIKAKLDGKFYYFDAKGKPVNE